jgi:hypothetical protein
VAVWALLGIEFISGDTKDVVALDADPVDVGWCRLGRLFGFRRMIRRRMGNGVHAAIVACEAWRIGASPRVLEGIPRIRGGRELCGEME